MIFRQIVLTVMLVVVAIFSMYNTVVSIDDRPFAGFMFLLAGVFAINAIYKALDYE